MARGLHLLPRRAGDLRAGLPGLAGRGLLVKGSLLCPPLLGLQLTLAAAARCRPGPAGPPLAAEPALPVWAAGAAAGSFEQLCLQPVVNGAIRYVRCGRQLDVFGTDVGVAEQGRLVRGLSQEFLEGEGGGQLLGNGRQAERGDEPAGVGSWSLVQELAEPAGWSPGHAFMIARLDVACHVLAAAFRPGGGTAVVFLLAERAGSAQ